MPLAGQFHGLNRLTAPAFVPPSESPDTVDAGHSADLLGLLGRRNGRRNVFANAYPLLGVVPVNLPGQRGRITADNNGDWKFVSVPWPAAVGPSSTVGAAASAAAVAAAAAAGTSHWDKVAIVGLTGNQTGVGSSNGTSQAIMLPAPDFASYGAILVGENGLLMTIGFGVATQGVVTLQGKINGGWTDLMTWGNYPNNTITQNYINGGGPGTLTDVRLVVQVTSGTGTVSATFDGDIYLVPGTLHTTFTAA